MPPPVVIDDRVPQEPVKPRDCALVVLQLLLLLDALHERVLQDLLGDGIPVAMHGFGRSDASAELRRPSHRL